MSTCPCGSSNPYTECCEPIISGSQSASTAEQLMRARYSAYTLTKMDFIFESTHPDHRQDYDHAGTKEWAESAEWQGLEIIGTVKGAADDATGEVEFIARFKEKGVAREHHEAGQFEQKDGRWYFAEGHMVRQKPLTTIKIGRNDPCTCGSGAKYKKCCGK